ncbi:MAG: hypothetical protein J1G06_04090 [Oscillospiraceae bacterium]|nr:hypothetical protein [Oscillospiraceae bacterium]
MADALRTSAILSQRSTNFVNRPPTNKMHAAAREDAAAIGAVAPNDIINKITAIMKYVQGSMIFISFQH